MKRQWETIYGDELPFNNINPELKECHAPEGLEDIGYKYKGPFRHGAYNYYTYETKRMARPLQTYYIESWKWLRISAGPSNLPTEEI